MKHTLINFTAALLLMTSANAFGQSGVAINPTGNTADSSSMLDVSSNSKGFLLPRMTQAERDMIANPAEGLAIFNTDTRCFNFFSNNSWFELCGNCIPPPTPAASDGGDICEGDTLFLYASNIPNVTYSWTGPNGFTSYQQNPMIYTAAPAASGTYQVVAIAGGCSSSPASTSANVVAIPSAAFSFSPASPGINTTVTFSAGVSGATYNWIFQSGNPATSTVQNPIVQWSSVGTYNVSLTITMNGCSSTLDTTVTVVSCTYTPGSQTFSYTGGAQTFTVPQCVNQITIECWGAQGWSGTYQGGRGGKASGTLNVTPGAQYYVYVGQQGQIASASYTPMGGGWNGGGNGQSNSGGSVGGGGGASDVRTVYNSNPIDLASLNSRLIVGAGGGGSTNNGVAYGGNGGGLTGQDGGQHMSYHFGTGGTQTAGGDANGGFGYGGYAESWMTPWNGGGGGGWYGGGVSTAHSGGGGGSSYIGGVTGGSTQSGIRTGHGEVVISW